jgi:hypothetical protein
MSQVCAFASFFFGHSRVIDFFVNRPLLDHSVRHNTLISAIMKLTIWASGDPRLPSRICTVVIHFEQFRHCKRSQWLAFSESAIVAGAAWKSVPVWLPVRKEQLSFVYGFADRTK